MCKVIEFCLQFLTRTVSKYAYVLYNAFNIFNNKLCGVHKLTVVFSHHSFSPGMIFIWNPPSTAGNTGKMLVKQICSDQSSTDAPDSTLVHGVLSDFTSVNKGDSKTNTYSKYYQMLKKEE